MFSYNNDVTELCDYDNILMQNVDIMFNTIQIIVK